MVWWFRKTAWSVLNLKSRTKNMNILIIIAAVWGGFFLLSVALAMANSRSKNALETKIDFRVNPMLFSGRDEDIQPLRQIITSKMKGSATDRRARRLSGADRETIFVVDDDPDVLNLIKHVLDLEGFDIRSFTCPEEALEEFRAAEKKPEMVVTDFCMQPMNGLELISRCRETVPDLKTIVISGMVDEDSLNKMPNQSNGFIHKPFKVSNLIQTLNETLTRN
jgi:CheY-like chemotaxis protein